MKRIALAVCLASFAAYAAAQGQSPFLGHNDRGETVHVLPPPAAVSIAHDPDPTLAPVSDKTAVYRASYGAGNLRDHGGPEIANAGFWAIYYNSTVAGATVTSNSTSTKYADLQHQMDAFINAFPDNHNWDNSTTDDYEIIQQYGSHANIANTLQNWGYYVDNQSTPSTISDTQLQQYLAGLFNSGKVTAYANIIYGIYMPAGTQVTLGSSASCSSFCGYHSHFTYGSMQIKYAIFPYLNCSGCSLSNFTVGDMLTIVTSHEIREAVTDPGDNGTNAWYARTGYEADDKCAWHNLYQITNGGFWVQPEYSNGGTTSNSGFTATYPGSGCVVPNR